MPAEQYRPESWGEVVGSAAVRVRQAIDGQDTPNFLFHGPPGTGKTTTARLVARELHGTDDDLMVFNASDDRGIETVRDDIIPVVNRYTLSGRRRIVFLDEMDSMTTDAQEALRQPMEQSPAVFILACNDVSAVTDAIRSRCYERGIEFGPLSDDAIRERIRSIAADEGVDLSGDHLESIVSFANGDMRPAIQQYTQYARGVYAEDERIQQAAANLSD